MGVTLKKQRDGTMRPFWYGEYTEADGRRKVVNLNLKWRGTPPESLRLPGDKDFENSREKAEDALARFVEDARHKGRAEHLVERLIESKTGAAPEYVTISDLADRWLSMTRDAPLSKGYTVMCRAIFGRFVAFMQERDPKARCLYQVKPADANAFAAAVRDAMSPKTYREHLRLLRPAFDRFLPVGSVNPFRKLPKGGKGKKHEMAGSIHRKPFTESELDALIAAANGDDFMGDLITAAACTGLRRGDVCRLKWADVDLVAGWVTVKTSKTDETVELPVYERLRPVLEARQGTGNPLVFPKAARMLEESPDGLTYRFKKIVARVFEGGTPGILPEVVPASDIEAEGVNAIREHVTAGNRRERMLDTFDRYCNGASVRDIEKATGRARATVSYDLQTIENWTGRHFMRRRPGRHTKGQTSSVKAAIARTTRVERKQGLKAASVRDWHALRTTFVTMALLNGADIDTVRRVTGHRTVDIVLRNYFRPDREQFRVKLRKALPDVLTGGKPRRLLPADELAALAGKVAAGTATEKDKKRLRVLAAKV